MEDVKVDFNQGDRSSCPFVNLKANVKLTALPPPAATHADAQRQTAMLKLCHMCETNRTNVSGDFCPHLSRKSLL